MRPLPLMPAMSYAAQKWGSRTSSRRAWASAFRKAACGLLPWPDHLGRSCIPSKAVNPGAASSASHATLPIPAVTSRAICALMLSSVAPPVSSRPFAYKQLACGSPQTKKSICLLDNLGFRCSP